MKKRCKIVVLGDILYDCFVWADRLPRKGETVTGYDNGFFSGGKGANQAVAAARLGAEVHLIGKVGDDDRGRFLLSELAENGVNTDYITVDPSVATGTTCIHVASDGCNAIIVAPMANGHIRQAEVELARGVIEGADVFLTQLQVPLAIAKHGLSIAREAGVVTVLDPAPPTVIEDETLVIPEFLTPNETEAEFYSGVSQEGLGMAEWCKEAAAALRRKGAQKLLLTLGGNGVYYDDGEASFFQKCMPVKAVDTTAAGDTFNAAFAVALARGFRIDKAVQYGSGAASLSTTKKGSQPSLPTYEELDAYFSELKESEGMIVG